MNQRLLLVVINIIDQVERILAIPRRERSAEGLVILKLEFNSELRRPVFDSYLERNDNL